MAQGALHERLARQASGTVSSIRAVAAHKAADIRLSLAEEQVRRRNQEWREKRRRRTRAGRIITGLKALAAVGRQPEIQELIQLRGPLMIWGDSWSSDGWLHQWGIALNDEEVVFYDEVFIGGKLDAGCEPMRHELAYDCVATWSQSRWLVDLCGRTTTINFRDEELMAMKDAFDERELLWQHLAECANPKQLERYVSNALVLGTRPQA